MRVFSVCFFPVLAWLSADCAEMCNRSDYRPWSDFRDGFHVSEQQGELVCSHIHVATESCRPCLSKVVLSLQGCNSPNLQVFMCSCQVRRKKEEKKVKLLFPAQQEPDSSWAQQDQKLLLLLGWSHQPQAGFWLLPSSELQVWANRGAKHRSSLSCWAWATDREHGLVSPALQRDIGHPHWMEWELRSHSSSAVFISLSSTALPDLSSS